jgi:hypothetical protein
MRHRDGPYLDPTDPDITPSAAVGDRVGELRMKVSEG